MNDPHSQMHEIYGRIGSMWAENDRTITDQDFKDGKVDEVIRRCRDKLGGRDQDLVGPEIWAEACRARWSPGVTYRSLWPKPNASWRSYIHDKAHDVYMLLPLSRGGIRNYDNHSLEQARIEFELAEIVVGWLKDEARGVGRTFEPLMLSRPGS
jgi:hypothetical protein